MNARGKRLKWVILFVAGDVLLAAAITTYTLISRHETEAAKKAAFSAELKKAQVITSTQGK